METLSLTLTETENVIYYTINGKLVLSWKLKTHLKNFLVDFDKKYITNFSWGLSGLNWLNTQIDSSAIR